jgi:hypothetical protein
LSRQPVRNRTDAMRVLLEDFPGSWSRLGRVIDRLVMGCLAAGTPALVSSASSFHRSDTGMVGVNATSCRRQREHLRE